MRVGRSITGGRNRTTTKVFPGPDLRDTGRAVLYDTEDEVRAVGREVERRWSGNSGTQRGGVP